MTVAALRRLPGFAFEAQVPVYDDVLPRMDVAVFAGFAASGPVNLPVPVEDPARFAAVFGADAPLAWDGNLGRTAYAQLGPAVRMFFANGGRRCWVVRLAGAAQNNGFPVPGVAIVTAGGGEGGTSGTIAPLTLTARSPGSWSDGVQLSASLTSRRFGVIGWSAGRLVLIGPDDAPLQSGDLLQVSWPQAGVEGYVGVEAVASQSDGGRRRKHQEITFTHAQWFDTAGDQADDGITIGLDVAPQQAPRPGEVVIADVNGKELVLVVAEVAIDAEADAVTTSPADPRHRVMVRGKGLWRRSAMPVFSPDQRPTVKRLGVDLWARSGDGNGQRVGNLGLAPSSARHITLLPDDAAVYAPGGSLDAALWGDAIAPRFPVAGHGQGQLCIPFGVGALPEHYLRAQIPAGTPLERDGLVPFTATLFADESLAGSLSTTLVADAEYQRFLAPRPGRPDSQDPWPLIGLHAALPIEEATLISIPDAAQPGWVTMEEGKRLEPQAIPVVPPDPYPRDDFVDCGAFVGASPVLAAWTNAGDGSIQLEWTGEQGTRDGPFVVEEATSHDWRDATVVFEGEARETMLSGRRPGDYYYRVRGVHPHPTEWSLGVPLRVSGSGGWRLQRPVEYRDAVLVAVHRLMLRFCAARRDAMAVLSLPEHYDEDAAAGHARLLASPNAPFLQFGAREVPPLGTGEADALSFAALYHGWSFTRGDQLALRAISPDGLACGVIARRATERGAWVAPANELLRGVFALQRPAPASRWLDLQQLNINVVRQLPRGFAVMSADTLALDDDVRPINVRRLLIMLRRLATRCGAMYVFEPNDDAFRRMVQRGFEDMLGDLFQRGAFAGSTASSAFQVVTGESLNTPRSADQGRFIVELRVAPSRPMVFLTLRLVRTGDRLTVSGV